MMDFCDIDSHANTCLTCGSRWSAFEFHGDCPECGGGAMQLPCPVCSGSCGAMWNRAILDSNDSGEAHWVGRCYHQYDRYEEPGSTPPTIGRHLFRFGYQSPQQLRLNALHGDDAESSEWIFVEAAGKRAAAELGRLYADYFVMKLFDATAENIRDIGYLWSEAGFAEWIEEDLREITEAQHHHVPVVRSPQDIVDLLNR